MTDQLEIEVNGIAPNLAGKLSEALICEQYVYDGSVCSPANVIRRVTLPMDVEAQLVEPFEGCRTK